MNLEPMSKAPRLRDRYRDEARSAAIDGACALLLKGSLPELRMDDVAREAGVSVGTLYNLFGDRDHLVAEVMKRHRAEVARVLATSVEPRPGDTFEAGLRRFIEEGYGFLLENWNLVRYVIAQSEAPPGECAPPPPARELTEAIWAAHEAHVRRGIAEGALRDEDPSLLTAMLLGTVRTVIFRDLWQNAPQRAEERARAISALFLRGAGLEPAAPVSAPASVPVPRASKKRVAARPSRSR